MRLTAFTVLLITILFSGVQAQTPESGDKSMQVRAVQKAAEPEANRWAVVLRNFWGDRKGWLQILSGRFVFKDEATTFTWSLPLRDVKNVKKDGNWVVIGTGRRVGFTDNGVRFRPKDLSAEELANVIRRLVADSSIVSAGDGFATIRDVLNSPSGVLLLNIDSHPVWILESQRTLGPPVVYLKPASHLGPGIQWVAADVELPPGSHTLTVTPEDSLICTVDFQAQAGRSYILKRAGKDSVSLKDRTTGETTLGRCAQDQVVDPREVATVDTGISGVTDVDGWRPLIGTRHTVRRNPYPAPTGVKLGADGKFSLSPGRHTISVAFFVKGFNYEAFSLFDCTLEFVAERGQRYRIHSKGLGGGLLGPPGRWKTWLQDSAGNIVASCGADK